MVQRVKVMETVYFMYYKNSRIAGKSVFVLWDEKQEVGLRGGRNA